jgi:AcrR family transcriptional regulator
MDEKKEYILKQISELYLKFGIKSVTMDDVASEFGISKKTLYQYFEDKADLVQQVIDFYLKTLAFDLNNKLNGNAIDRYFTLRAHIIHLLKNMHSNIEFDLKKLYPRLYRKVYKVKRERIFSNTVENMNEGIKQGLYRLDIDPELVAKLQVGRMLYTMDPQYEIFTERELMNIETFDKIMEYFMYSVCTEKGIKYYKEQLNKLKNDVEN